MENMENLVLIKRRDLSDLIKDAVADVLPEKKCVQDTIQNVINVDQAVSYLNKQGYPIKKSTLYKMTSKGSIPFYRWGRRKILFKPEELNEWIRAKIKKAV